jgi:hypothetical protein
MQDTKQIIRWALLLMATAAIVGLVVPNLGFGETLNQLNPGSVQKITMLGDRRPFDRTPGDDSKANNDRYGANFKTHSGRK